MGSDFYYICLNSGFGVLEVIKKNCHEDTRTQRLTKVSLYINR